MKIRQGFVSNSSSSSFLMYGIYIDDTINSDELEKLMEDTYEKGDDGQYHAIEAPFRELTRYCRSYCGTTIGKSWGCVGDNETGAEFKERVERRINELLDAVGYTGERKFGTHEDAWYDG